MRWENWPNAALSRFVDHGRHQWHLQVGGAGPTLLLIHGAGAAGMSFRHLMADLAADFRVVAVDLPGHGFSRMGSRQRMGLSDIAADLAGMLAGQGLTPAIAVGHSAGGAVALRLAGHLPLTGIVGINAALSPFKGMAGWLFPMMAKALSANPLTAVAVSLSTSEPAVRALLRGTGSRIDAEGVRLYRRLVASPAHVDGTLAMMAQWRLEGVFEGLDRVGVPVRLIATEGDRVVPPEVSAEAARRLPQAELVRLPGLGHLAHEEAPAQVAGLIRDFASRLGVAPGMQKAAGFPAA